MGGLEARPNREHQLPGWAEAHASQVLKQPQVIKDRGKARANFDYRVTAASLLQPREDQAQSETPNEYFRLEEIYMTLKEDPVVADIAQAFLKELVEEGNKKEVEAYFVRGGVNRLALPTPIPNATRHSFSRLSTGDFVHHGVDLQGRPIIRVDKRAKKLIEDLTVGCDDADYKIWNKRWNSLRPKERKQEYRKFCLDLTDSLGKRKFNGQDAEISEPIIEDNGKITYFIRYGDYEIEASYGPAGLNPLVETGEIIVRKEQVVLQQHFSTRPNKWKDVFKIHFSSQPADQEAADVDSRSGMGTSTKARTSLRLYPVNGKIMYKAGELKRVKHILEGPDIIEDPTINIEHLPISWIRFIRASRIATTFPPEAGSFFKTFTEETWLHYRDLVALTIEQLKSKEVDKVIPGYLDSILAKEIAVMFSQDPYHAMYIFMFTGLGRIFPAFRDLEVYSEHDFMTQGSLISKLQPSFAERTLLDKPWCVRNMEGLYEQARLWHNLSSVAQSGGLRLTLEAVRAQERLLIQDGYSGLSLLKHALLNERRREGSGAGQLKSQEFMYLFGDKGLFTFHANSSEFHLDATEKIAPDYYEFFASQAAQIMSQLGFIANFEKSVRYGESRLSDKEKLQMSVLNEKINNVINRLLAQITEKRDPIVDLSLLAKKERIDQREMEQLEKILLWSGLLTKVSPDTRWCTFTSPRMVQKIWQENSSGAIERVRDDVRKRIEAMVIQKGTRDREFDLMVRRFDGSYVDAVVKHIMNKYISSYPSAGTAIYYPLPDSYISLPRTLEIIEWRALERSTRGLQPRNAPKRYND